MSMIGNYLRCSEAEVHQLLQEPSLIMGLLYPEDDADFPADRHLDIDKAWHLIHFLFTNEQWTGQGPLVNVVLGGTEIGEEDVGYGPARYLVPSQVKETAEALDSISPAELWGRFDLEKVTAADIYPSGWLGDQTEGQYVCNYFGKLKNFFTETAKQHQAMIVYLNRSPETQAQPSQLKRRTSKASPSSPVTVQ